MNKKINEIIEKKKDDQKQTIVQRKSTIKFEPLICSSEFNFDSTISNKDRMPIYPEFNSYFDF